MENDLIEQEEPRIAKFSTEQAEPRRRKERTEKELPKHEKSSVSCCLCYRCGFFREWSPK